MSEDNPPLTLELVWEHDLVLAGRSGDTEIRLDSAKAEGPSPTQALAFGLAGCMAMDLLHILTKGRHDFKGLRADLTGTRADDHPRRFTTIHLHYTITGTVEDAAVQRAIDLSREKYCSVWQSMRQDIDFSITFKVSAGV